MALADELLALLTLLITSSLGTMVSATDMSLLLKPITIDVTRRTARVATATSLFTPTPSSFDYTISQPRIEDINNVLVVFIFG
jgi:hypothetical protein